MGIDDPATTACVYVYRSQTRRRPTLAVAHHAADSWRGRRDQRPRSSAVNGLKMRSSSSSSLAARRGRTTIAAENPGAACRPQGAWRCREQVRAHPPERGVHRNDDDHIVCTTVVQDNFSRSRAFFFLRSRRHWKTETIYC